MKMFHYEVCYHQIFYTTNKLKSESCGFKIRLNSDSPSMLTAIFYLIMNLYKF